jgi:lipopolysaccharide assembly protein A
LRLLVWLFRAFIFFSLFAFSLNNQQAAAVNWFFGYAWQAPMVIIVLVAFAAGTVFGVLAMTPSWWHHRRRAQRLVEPAAAAAPGTVKTAAPEHPPGIIDGI